MGGPGVYRDPLDPDFDGGESQNDNGLVWLD